MTPSSELPHVLVIDDNQDATEVLAMLIEIEGWTVATARTLAQGRAQVDRRRPDLVLLDLNLPDGSGMKLLSELKADPATAAIPVVILSGMLDIRVKEETQHLGAADFLAKPFAQERLSRVLQLAH